MYSGPYYRYFMDEDPFLRQGAVLIFIGFLADWQSGSGFAFVTDKGRTVHPFDKYLTSILNAYETSDKEVVSSMQSLYAFAVSLLTLLDSKGDIEKRLPTVNLDLLRRLRTSIRDNAYNAYNASNRAGTWIPDYDRLYVDFIRPYFLERVR